MRVKFKEWNCVVIPAQYSNGRLAFRLVDEVSLEPVAVATVNIPEFPLEPGQVLIKNYSENEGMLEALIKAGLVEDTGIRVLSGWVKIPLCNVLISNNEL